MDDPYWTARVINADAVGRIGTAVLLGRGGTATAGRLELGGWAPCSIMWAENAYSVTEATASLSGSCLMNKRNVCVVKKGRRARGESGSQTVRPCVQPSC